VIPKRGDSLFEPCRFTALNHTEYAVRDTNENKKIISCFECHCNFWIPPSQMLL